jgi:hypothetical protein
MIGYSPDVRSYRCHFIVTAGVIHFCGDSTEFAGQSLPLEPWPDDTVRYYDVLTKERLKNGGVS